MALLESIAAAVLLSGANYADYHTTRSALDAGMTEANASIGQSGQRLELVKVGAVAGEMAVYSLLRKKNKALAWAWVATIVGVNLAVAKHNHAALEEWNR
jgi:hypothetical protein